MKRTPLRRVSKKQAKRLDEYRKLKEEMVRFWAYCEVVGCFRKVCDVHHTKGRLGKNLLDTKTWMMVCRECHRKIHDNVAWAKEKGYLK